MTKLEKIAELCRKAKVAETIEQCKGYVASIEKYAEMSDAEFILRQLLDDKNNPVTKELVREVRRGFPF